MTARLTAQGAVLLTALLLQTVLLPAVAVAGWRPDLVGLTVVAFALSDGPDTGARYGFAAGLATDLLSGESHVVGLTALVLLTVGWAVGSVRSYLSGTALVGPAAVAACAGAGAFALYGLLTLLLDLGQFTATSLAQGTLAVALWNLALAPLVCPAVGRLSRRFAVADAARTAGSR